MSQSALHKVFKLFSKQAVGPEGVNINMQKLCTPYYVPAITDIIITSIKNVAFPEKWKNAKIKN